MSDTDTSSHAIECTAISDVELCTMYLLLQDRNDSNPWAIPPTACSPSESDNKSSLEIAMFKNWLGTLICLSPRQYLASQQCLIIAGGDSLRELQYSSSEST